MSHLDKPHRNWRRTRLTHLLGIDYPIIQGPLGGFRTETLTAAVSNFGGLGSYGGLNLDPARLTALVGELKAATSKPFAVNLWVSMEDAGARTSGVAEFEQARRAIEPMLRELGAATPEYKPYVPVKFEDQAQALLDAGVPVMSFIFGVPPREILDECRRRGIPTIAAATTPDEAKLLDDAGVDVIAASGFEAGGHKGSFLAPAEDSLTGTMSLVPQIVDAVRAPVVAAGGISDARQINAAFALGASGVQMGTIFLPCAGSGATDLHRAALVAGGVHTGLSKGFTGRLARAIHNRLLDEMNAPGIDVLPYPLQRALMRNLADTANAAKRPELIAMWAGQSAPLVRACEDPAVLLQRLVAEVARLRGE
jgi:nitronate monooxygenase